MEFMFGMSACKKSHLFSLLLVANGVGGWGWLGVFLLQKLHVKK
jgi:hypothetical protein